MATSTFDLNFENKKTQFKQKFGIEWNINPQLYLTYLQTLFIAELYDTTSRTINTISHQQNDTHKLLQHISKELSK